MTEGYLPLAAVVRRYELELTANGLARTKKERNLSAYMREVETGYYLIAEIQRNKYADEHTYTLNLGGYDASVNQRLGWPTQDPKLTTSASATWRLRLCQVVPGDCPGWWPLTEQGVVDGLQTLSRYGLPFLERVSSRRALIDEWDRGQWPDVVSGLVLTAELAEVGNIQRAEKLAADLAAGARGQPLEQAVQRLLSTWRSAQTT